MNIYQRMAAVMQDVQYLAKDDQVEFKNTRYRAITEEKVTSTMRNVLLKHGLVVFPVEQERTRIGTITSVDVKYRLQNIDDPEDFVIIASAGDGADTQDKGAGKAMTYAFKYMFLRAFAIPTGEDPDKVCSAEMDEAEKPDLVGDVEIETLKKVVKALGGTTANDFKRITGVPLKDLPGMTKAQWGETMAALNRQMDDAQHKAAMNA